MPTKPYQTTFTISEVGDVTQETFKAEFVTSTVLSGRQQLLQDQLYREYVGKDPQWADADIRRRCDIMATINSALQAPLPQFWRESNNGWDLLDDNVMLAVYAGVVKALNEEAEKRKKRTEESSKRLQKAVERGPDKAPEEEEQKPE